MLKASPNLLRAGRKLTMPAAAAAATRQRLPACVPSTHRRCCMGTLAPSRPLLDQINIKVPTMGDSITEGTIVEWTAQVGQLVKEGDVVALVETDKVTVDIKAETDGVIVTQYGSVDDTVEVGADLYQIDTEATETPGGFFEVVPAEEEELAASSASATDGGSAAAGHGRTPSIHFLGKAGWAKLLAAPVRSREADIAAGVPPAIGGPEPVTVDGAGLGRMYGRPNISEREMEALMMGGADDAPKMISPSRAALFGH